MRIWDASSGELLQTIQAHPDWVFSVAWSVDGSKLASSSRDHTVRIWDVATQQLLQTLVGHDGYVYATDWSPGDELVSSSEDVTIRRWSPNP